MEERLRIAKEAHLKVLSDAQSELKEFFRARDASIQERREQNRFLFPPLAPILFASCG